MSGLSLETCTSHLKSLALTVLELLAFNAHFSDWPLRYTHTDRQKHRHTSNERISAIHFVHLAEIKSCGWLAWGLPAFTWAAMSDIAALISAGSSSGKLIRQCTTLWTSESRLYASFRPRLFVRFVIDCALRNQQPTALASEKKQLKSRHGRSFD